MSEVKNEKKYVAVEEILLNKMLSIIQQLPYASVATFMEEVKKEGNIIAIEEKMQIK
jgi:hypothetical protein